MLKQVLTTALGLLAVCGALQAQDKIHIIHDIDAGKTTSIPWQVTDGAGFRWDIYPYGQVNDGTNDAYDGGMMLQISGSTFSPNNSTAPISKDGQEIELGPWQYGNMRVYRRIYVDKKLGYCRWIDIFENTNNQAQTLPLQYYTNVGGSVHTVMTTSNKPTLTDRDWGMVTTYSTTEGSRPSLVQFFTTRSSKLKPQVEYSVNNDNIYYRYNLEVPAGETIAICTFHAQRRPYKEATKMLKSFNVETELAKVPGPLRKLIVNMTGAVTMLGQLELPRSEKADLAVTIDGDELLGDILAKEFVVETFYGKVTLPAERVVGLAVPTSEAPTIQLALVDGQVLAGELKNGPLKLRLTNGNEMSLKITKLRSLAYRISGNRPAEITAAAQPALLLSRGQQVFFNAGDLDYTFATKYGRIKLDPATIKSIVLDGEEGCLHRVEFLNSSVLSGMLLADEIKLTLELGPEMKIGRGGLSRIEIPGEVIEPERACVLQLRNDDLLLGELLEESLELRTPFGTANVKPAEIAEITAAEEGGMGDVQIKLRDGSTVNGTLTAPALRFRISPGPELAVSTTHIVSMHLPEPAAEEDDTDEAEADTDEPQTQPMTDSTTGPTTGPTLSNAELETIKRAQALAEQEAEKRAKIDANRKQITARLKQFQAVRAELAKANEKNPTDETKKRIAVIDKQIAELTKMLEQ